MSFLFFLTETQILSPGCWSFIFEGSSNHPELSFIYSSLL
nr:MAG TPA: hypothetical protein [Bacteriophage sp.]